MIKERKQKEAEKGKEGKIGEKKEERTRGKSRERNKRVGGTQETTRLE